PLRRPGRLPVDCRQPPPLPPARKRLPDPAGLRPRNSPPTWSSRSSQSGAVDEDHAGRLLPALHPPYADRRLLVARGTKQIAVGHVLEVPQHVEAVVNEVGQAQLPGDAGLLLSPAAEDDVVAGHAGLLVEAVVLEPLARPPLRVGARFGDNEQVGAESPFTKLSEGDEHTGDRGC